MLITFVGSMTLLRFGGVFTGLLYSVVQCLDLDGENTLLRVLCA